MFIELTQLSVPRADFVAQPGDDALAFDHLAARFIETGLEPLFPGGGLLEIALETTELLLLGLALLVQVGDLAIKRFALFLEDKAQGLEFPIGLGSGQVLLDHGRDLGETGRSRAVALLHTEFSSGETQEIAWLEPTPLDAESVHKSSVARTAVDHFDA